MRRGDPVDEALEAARDAVRRHAWTQAVSAFAAVDQASGALAAAGRAAALHPAAAEALSSAGIETGGTNAGLSPDDLELYGQALWWTGQPDDSSAALERAFAGYNGAGRRLDAARVAMTLGYQAFRGLAGPVGGGWMAQAGRLLAAEPEGPMHARMAMFQMVPHLEQH